ncbi:DUF2169 domain-containing protein [Persicimonas caeni]|uniref:DUF2169 domain-containing protein n=1 Tax=Persicimonas caeni TaxID=2292766 RepID=A0A4Y6PVB1_PERCE|nr:DUF2169 domain-containing protein [Persicimonas caeni]QDG52262.1 DUF2169 domain-containing protein [Persicimonas caeni]QED33484.1 DUF2169 domain-containing protein [Persicimonas caeni]
MEVVGHPALSARLVMGHRVWGGAPQAVLTAVAKASYAVGAGGELTRVAPADLVMTEQVYNGGADRDEQVVRYESDLVPYKPKADLVVLGEAGGGVSRWVEWLATGGKSLSRDSRDTHWGPSMNPALVTFGWLRADLEPRLLNAGSDLENFDPAQLLPDDFSNAFYNAGVCADMRPPYSNSEPPFDHLSPDQSVHVLSFRDPNDDGSWDDMEGVALRTPAVFPGAHIERRSGGQVSLDMRLDTFVYDRSAAHLDLVWRGALAYAPADLADFGKLVFDWEDA